MNVKALVPYKSSRDSLVKVTWAFSKIVSVGFVFLNQNEELLLDVWVIVVIPPISILLHSATSLPVVVDTSPMVILESIIIRMET